MNRKQKQILIDRITHDRTTSNKRLNALSIHDDLKKDDYY
jgi:hypothetical protein